MVEEAKPPKEEPAPPTFDEQKPLPRAPSAHADVRVKLRCRRCQAEVPAIRYVRGNAFAFSGDLVDVPPIGSWKRLTHRGCGGELSFRGVM